MLNWALYVVTVLALLTTLRRVDRAAVALRLPRVMTLCVAGGLLIYLGSLVPGALAFYTPPAVAGAVLGLSALTILVLRGLTADRAGRLPDPGPAASAGPWTFATAAVAVAGLLGLQPLLDHLRRLPGLVRHTGVDVTNDRFTDHLPTLVDYARHGSLWRAAGPLSSYSDSFELIYRYPALFGHSRWTLVPAALYALVMLAAGMALVGNAVIREANAGRAGEDGSRRSGGWLRRGLASDRVNAAVVALAAVGLFSWRFLPRAVEMPGADDLFLGATLIAALGLLLESARFDEPDGADQVRSPGGESGDDGADLMPRRDRGRAAVAWGESWASSPAVGRTAGHPARPGVGPAAGLAVADDAALDVDGMDFRAFVAVNRLDDALAAVRVRRRALLALSAGALGLAVGAKPAALPFVPLFMCLAAVLRPGSNAAGRRAAALGRAAFVACGAGLVGGFWYVRNVVNLGHPFDPANASGFDPSQARDWRDPRVYKAFLPRFLGGSPSADSATLLVGAAAVVVLLALIGYWRWQGRQPQGRGRRRAPAAAWALLAFLATAAAVFVVTPFVLSRERPWSLRPGAPFFAAAAVVLGLAAAQAAAWGGWRGRPGRWVVLGLAAALLIGLPAGWQRTMRSGLPKWERPERHPGVPPSHPV